MIFRSSLLHELDYINVTSLRPHSPDHNSTGDLQLAHHFPFPYLSGLPWKGRVIHSDGLLREIPARLRYISADITQSMELYLVKCCYQLV